MFRSKLGLSFSLSIISLCLTTVEPTCSKGCDLALGSYYVWTDAYTRLVAEVSGNSVNELISYNPGTTERFILSGSRIVVPFACDCIDGEFLAHVFTYTARSGDTYDKIAKTYYANLTTAATLERSNSYPANSSIPVNATVNVTVNCSCGNASVSEAYRLFVTYPLRAEDSLESIANATNLSTDLLQRYNPGANFNAGSGLVYIPGKGTILFCFAFHNSVLGLRVIVVVCAIVQCYGSVSHNSRVIENESARTSFKVKEKRLFISRDETAPIGPQVHCSD
ncbi:lysM domain receptor-like kinase 3 [Rhododendron vialii]|uniref:lysM domain receptor-like kinase 3 n=1 Tax=Rhododendron vialii TaxID=182163 RepID=UPI00265F6D4D|nr:lysM domain receptor-like kinase 3 [Rhododendron vialii]